MPPKRRQWIQKFVYNGRMCMYGCFGLVGEIWNWWCYILCVWASRYERDNICIKPVSSNRDDEDEISHTDLADSTKHTQMKDHY